MITYTATNTKTGQFYIGSAKSYCHYMARIGSHHTRKPNARGYTAFQRDLQADPFSFVWEWSEDDLDDRSTEKSLIALYEGSKYLYNVGEGNWERRHDPRKPHTTETKNKMRAAALRPEANPAHKKAAQSRAVTATNSKKQPCPQCGMLMNVGNLTKHLKGTRCKGQPQVG
jgi:hypothetical protein